MLLSRNESKLQQKRKPNFQKIVFSKTKNSFLSSGLKVSFCHFAKFLQRSKCFFEFVFCSFSLSTTVPFACFMDPATRLNQLKQLKDIGAISHEQWAEQQAKEFSRLQSSSTPKIRKKPVCTACGLYREGHKIDLCKKIQEEKLRSISQKTNPQTAPRSQNQTSSQSSFQECKDLQAVQTQVSSTAQGTPSHQYDLTPEEFGIQKTFHLSFL
jgi:hypothetical protein